ncbi:MAG: F0F1 ATP synthase subunit alpha [Deltaproteobacteria bacterium]|nr:F0F1 ATP synthase subunit alpha [Deltaproteobacteria bacterium]
MLKTSLAKTRNAFASALASHEFSLTAEDVGRIIAVTGPVAMASGLAGVTSEELVRAEDGTLGIVAGLEPGKAGIILLGSGYSLKAGHEVKRLGRVADIVVGEALLGRVIDATGKPLDERGSIPDQPRSPLENPAPAIMERLPVAAPLATGIKVIDALIPIGQGQRELILGDRQTGKTSIALDAIVNQRDKNVICIYAAIGQRESAVAKVLHELREHGAMPYTVVVVAGGQDAPGLQYITPYAATSIGEYFMRQGRDVLIVYDDLTRHARAYREISLLLERSPGREAYPGDIFYIHSRLLERSTHLRLDLGGGSMTALPIVETEAQNLSAYIPTNIISITDGQIYLSPELFAKGMLPAVDVGKSVSRVGGKAQKEAYRDLVGQLRLSYAQFEELETFARFATRLDDNTQKAIERGKRVREALRQDRYSSLKEYEQVAVMLALTAGLLDRIEVKKIKEAEMVIKEAVLRDLPHICAKIHRGGKLDAHDRETLLDLCETALARLFAKGGP